jgi:hypothetical protein
MASRGVNRQGGKKANLEFPCELISNSLIRNPYW